MNLLGRWLRQWTGGPARDFNEGATAVVSEAFSEPLAEDVAWLTSVSSDRDEDHARWELRYTKRAFVLLAAKRDSLDDRTPSVIAHALERALSSDRDVDVTRRDVAARQFNARLRAYGQAIEERNEQPQSARLGRLMLSYVGVTRPAQEIVDAAAAILLRQLHEANASLRKHFGSASLPEDVAPSLAP